MRISWGATAAAACLVATTAQAFLVPPPATTTSTKVLAERGDDLVNRKDVLSFGLLSGAMLGLLGGSGMAQAAEEVPVFRNSLGGLLEIYTDIQKVRWQGHYVVLVLVAEGSCSSYHGFDVTARAEQLRHFVVIALTMTSSR